ncbi:MAG: VanZ family protein [Muribaculaceae bacterium]|nr:VanZ family protein [Muribaculaceae bacterium]
MKRFFLVIPNWTLSILGTLLVSYLSLAHDPFNLSRLHLFLSADKLAHFAMYFVLNAIYIFEYAKFVMPHHTRLNKELAITTWSALFGGFMEIGQLIMRNGRCFDYDDWIADALGAIVAFIVIRKWLMKHFRKTFCHSVMRRKHRRSRK